MKKPTDSVIRGLQVMAQSADSGTIEELGIHEDDPGADTAWRDVQAAIKWVAALRQRMDTP